MKIVILLSILSMVAFSDIKVMISKKNKLVSVTPSELAKVYLRKTDKIKGITVVPIDNKESYREFYSKVIKKTPKQLRAYWIKKIDKKKNPSKTIYCSNKKRDEKKPKYNLLFKE